MAAYRKDWIIFGDGAVGKDGTIYLGLRLCAPFVVAVSADEGQRWSLEVVPGGDLIRWDPTTQLAKIVTQPNILITEPLAVDTDGNVYTVWPDPSGLLRFSISKDHGKKCSTPLVVSAPEVTSAVYGNVTAKSPGTVAIAYYGSPDGQTTGWGVPSAHADSVYQGAIGRLVHR